jgi:hypothetical protein
VQVVQGTAVADVVLNCVALWKQEPRDPSARPRGHAARALPRTGALRAGRPQARRFLVAVGLGTMAFSMQDVILEPYGGEILHLGVGATTQLTALMAGGALLAFALAPRAAGPGRRPLPRRGAGRAGRPGRLRRGDLRRAARSRPPPVPRRRRADRLRRRPVLGRHADAAMGLARPTA